MSTNQRPTPITDAVWRKHTGFSPQSAADAYELAGNLERQLAEVSEQVAALETRHAATMLHTQAIVDDANALRGQLATLTAILKEIRAGYGGKVADPSCDCGDCAFLIRIDEALAAVKGGGE